MTKFVTAVYVALLWCTALVSAATPNRMIAEYLPDYKMSTYSAKSINYTHVTHVLYAFAGISADGHITLPSNFKQSVVDDIHAGKAKAILSIGGWGPFPFSTVFASQALRAIFVKDLTAAVITYGLDGIDIDWEFPNRDVGAGLPTNSADSANFLIGLNELRAALPSQVTISATVPILGFIGPTQDVWMTDLSGFAAVLDFLTVMAYDLNGSWGAVTGPNAPLQENGVNYGGSVVYGINALTAAKFPLNKLVLGTPFPKNREISYGHTFITTQSMLGNAPTNQAATHNGAPTGDMTYTQIIDFLQSLKVRDGNNPKFVSHFDTNTMTPWIYDAVSSKYITYDNERSIAAKSKFAGCIGLKGVFSWEASQDGNQLVPFLSEVNTLSTGTVASCLELVLNSNVTPSTIITTVTPTATTTTSLKGTSTTTTAPASTTTTAPDCYPPWSASSTYNGGAQVSYQSFNYIANWWAGPSDVPPAAAWKSVGPCGGSQSTTTTTTTTTKPATSTIATSTTTAKTATKSTTASTLPTSTTVKPTTTTTKTIAATTTTSSSGPVVGQPCSAGKSECSAGKMYYCLGSSWIVWYIGC
ncbi:glycoside hydrolase superfamily [Obelidium mucronatum]|nr:glycoside hydrolase superfamily [Obelidium mucronatum]